MALTFLDNRDQSLQKGEVLNDYLALLGPCWSLSADFSFNYPLPCIRSLVSFLYLPLYAIRCDPTLNRIYHYWAINLQMFTPIHQTSLLLPPNQ